MQGKTSTNQIRLFKMKANWHENMEAILKIKHMKNKRVGRYSTCKNFLLGKHLSSDKNFVVFWLPSETLNKGEINKVHEKDMFHYSNIEIQGKVLLTICSIIEIEKEQNFFHFIDWK